MITDDLDPAAYALWIDTDGTAPINEDVICWFQDPETGSINISVKYASDNTLIWYGGTSDYQRVSLGTGHAVEARFPRNHGTGLTGDIILGEAQSHSSASYTSVIKDHIPDQNETYKYIEYHMANETQDSSGILIDEEGDPITEFSHLLIPIIGMIALFAIFRKYKKK